MTDPWAEAVGEAADTTAPLDTGQLRFGEQLTAEQRAEMENLLRGYSDVLTDRIGCTKLIQHDITVTDETPCFQPSYRIPEALREKVEEELRSMEESGVIQYDPYNTWNSPLIVVRKSDGNIRLVNSFIELNKRTVPEPYTITRSDELLNRVAGARLISKIDLKKSFFSM